MNPVRVTLVGPSLAGRATSLSVLIQRTSAEAWRIFDNRDRSVVVGDTKVVSSVASMRSQYLDARPEVVEELQRLSTSSAFIFVVDSQQERIEAGGYELDRLRSDLRSQGIDLDGVATVFQLNKRDLKNAASAAELENRFRTGRCRYVESVATDGRGVVEAFETALAMVEGR